MTFEEGFQEFLPVALDAATAFTSADPTAKAAAEADALQRVTTALANSSHPAIAAAVAHAPEILQAAVAIKQNPSLATLFQEMLQSAISFKL